MKKTSLFFGLLLMLCWPDRDLWAEVTDFRAVVDSRVELLVEQPDGRILIGGSFQSVGGRPCRRICRVLADGQLDPDFQPLFLRRTPDAMAVLPDGGIVLAFSPSPLINGEVRNRLVRLNADGSLDQNFQVELGQGPASFPPRITAIAVQEDGRFLIAGRFATVNGVSRSNLARLHPDGQLDSSFNANAAQPADPDNSNRIDDMVRHPDGTVFIYQRVFDPDVSLSRRIRRLSSTGVLDTTFLTELSGTLESMIVLADGRVVLGGDFTVLGDQQRYIARLDLNGGVDPGFSATSNHKPYALVELPNQRLLVAGHFSEFNGNPAVGVVRLLGDGSTDPDFVSPIGQGGLVSGNLGFIDSMVVSSNGDILVGGGFNETQGQLQRNLARLGPDGQVLRLPDPEVDDGIFAFASQPDGHIWVGGRFRQIGGLPRDRLARLLPDGRVDPDFSLGASSTVRALAVMPDGGVLVAGAFFTLAGHSRRHLGRLGPDGSLDTDFNANVLGGAVRSLALQPDGRIVIAGIMDSVGGEPRPNLARINADGSVDAGFAPAPNGEVRSVAVDHQGRLLVGGLFTQIAGANRSFLARLNANGTLDESLAVAINGEVRVISVTPEGRIMLGGAFSEVAGQERIGIAVLNSDGSLHLTENAELDAGPVNGLLLHNFISFNGEFSQVQNQPRSRVAVVFTSFFPLETERHDADAAVFALHGTGDGRLFLGGDFTTINAQARAGLAMTRGTGSSFELQFDRNLLTLVWSGVGLQPEPGVSLELSLDGQDYALLGSMEPHQGGHIWKLNTAFIPPMDAYYLRVSGHRRGSFANGSVSRFEFIDLLPGKGDLVFTDRFRFQ